MSPRQTPTAGGTVQAAARLLLNLIGAVAVVALLLFLAYRVVIAPAQASSTQAVRATPAAAQGQSPGGPRGLAIRFLLAARKDDLEPVSADPDARPVTFEVTSGETAADVALRLQNVGLIRDATAFRLLLQYHGLDRRIEAGRSQLSPAMSSMDIGLALMRASANDVALVTIEGWRLEQTAEAVELIFGQGDVFLDVATRQAPAALPDWVGRPDATRSLEGFLSPNTYRFMPDATAQDVIAAMLADFTTRFDQSYRDRARELGLTPYEVVIIASIVEREAVVAEERPTIAAVFLNRVRLGMRLEADPTVQYAIGYQEAEGRWWKTPLLLSDLRDTDSPYNTYMYAGLPPGPICSPGFAAIEAVLWPEDVDYLYFVARGDGSHAFSRTFDEHLRNVARYRGG